MTRKIDLNILGGVMIGGKMECSINRGTAERAKRDLDTTIGRNPVTGKVTSKAEKVYKDDASVKNSRRVDKARKSFEKAQRDLEAEEEIKEKADKNKGK